MDLIRKELAADVDAERIPGDDPWPDRFRLAVVSQKFHGMTQLERQDMLWGIVDRVLGSDGSMSISLVLAFAPDEIESGNED